MSYNRQGIWLARMVSGAKTGSRPNGPAATGLNHKAQLVKIVKMILGGLATMIYFPFSLFPGNIY